MARFDKEVRRMAGQVVNFVRHGKFNPYGRSQRRNKPQILRRQQRLEIQTPLELIAAYSALAEREFFFLQIGAFDGSFDDPIASLVRKYRWRGVLVEPQPGAFAKLQVNYADQSQVSFENAAIAAEDGETTLYTLKNSATPMASFDRRHLVRHAQRQADIVSHTVPCVTLATLINKHNIGHIDLLQIDAEGYDFEIIRQIDFTALQPTLIRYEHANLLQNDRNDCIELLANQGYRVHLEDSDTLAFRGAA